MNLSNNSSTTSSMYNEFYFIYTKKYTIILWLFIFTITGYFFNISEVKKNEKQFNTAINFSCPAVNVEVIEIICGSINSMNAAQKAKSLNIPIDKANKILSVNFNTVKVTDIITDQIPKKIIILDVKHLGANNKGVIEKIFLNYLSKNEFIKSKLSKFESINKNKESTLNHLNDYLIKAEKINSKIVDLTGKNNESIGIAELYKLKIRWGSDILESAKMEIISSSTSENVIEKKFLIMLILPYSLLGFALSIIYIYFKSFLKMIKIKEKK